jgi:transposase
MASMTSSTATAQPAGVLFGGIDTHKDIHVAALLDCDGGLVGSASFPTTRAGYRQLLGWMHTFGILARVGVEGTGSYGAGICRQLTAAGVEVVEVNRPDRSQRRRRGKSDVLDAAAAAEAARPATASPSRNLEMARWSLCGCCGLPEPQRSRPAPKPSSSWIS